MATNLALEAAIRAANVTHTALYEELFSGDLPGHYKDYTYKIPVSSGIWQNQVAVIRQTMRKWTGARQTQNARAYTETLEAVPFEATLPVARRLMSRDQTGVVANMLRQFAEENVTVHDREITTSFDSASGAGPTGYDGVALFATTHPHGPSGNQSNLSAGTNLSHANLWAGRASMRQLRKENGENFNCRPTHLRVGSNLETRAKELTEATDRHVFIDNDGNVDSAGTDDVVSIAAKQDVWRGELTVIIDDRIDHVSGQEYYWTIMDLSKGSVKPMVLIEERAVEAINRTDMDDPRRFDYDEFLFGHEADFQVGAGMWQTAYRGTGTA